MKPQTMEANCPGSTTWSPPTCLTSPRGQLTRLPVSFHEPNLALDGGEDGLTTIHRLLTAAPAHLAEGGLLLLEIEASQGEVVRAMARKSFPHAKVQPLPGPNRQGSVWLKFNFPATEAICMKTQVLPITSPQAMPRALTILEAGGLVAFPTDTVYGLGACAFNAQAVESIYTAKERPVEKAIPILVAGMEDLEKVALDIPEMALKLGSCLLARCADPGDSKTPFPAPGGFIRVDGRRSRPRTGIHPAAPAICRTAGSDLRQPIRSAKPAGC